MVFLVQGIQGWQSCTSAEIPPKLGFMDVYGEYIYVLKIVQLDGLQMVENAKSQQGGP